MTQISPDDVFVKILESCKNISSTKDFSKTHSQTHQVHSWTAINLMEVRKLVRGQTNTQILRYLHFCENFVPIVEYPIDAQISLQRFYSRSRKGLYESCGITLAWVLSTCKCLAPGRAAKIDLKLTRRRFHQNFGVIRKSFLHQRFLQNA